MTAELMSVCISVFQCGSMRTYIVMFCATFYVSCDIICVLISMDGN